MIYQDVDQKGKEEVALIVMSILDQKTDLDGSNWVEGMHGHSETVNDVREAIDKASDAVLFYFIDDMNGELESSVHTHAYTFLREHGHHYYAFSSSDLSYSPAADATREIFTFMIYRAKDAIKRRLFETAVAQMTEGK